MNKNGNGNFVGVAEKRELAKLIEKQYDEAIQNAVSIEKELCEQAEHAVVNKLGVQLIITEIEKLDKQKELLINKIHEIGFDFNHGRPVIAKTWDATTNDSVWKKSSQASREAFKVLEGTTNLNDLRSQKTTTLKKLWLTTSRKEVVKIVGNGSIKVQLKSVNEAPALASKA